MAKEALIGVPLSKSQRRPDKRKSHGVHVELCICSVCGQQANAAPGTVHRFCDGMPPRFFDRAPGLRGKIHGPVKGEWATMADYHEAEKMWETIRKVIALFTLMAPPPPVEAKVKNGGKLAPRESVVESAVLTDRIRKYRPNSKVREGLSERL